MLPEQTSPEMFHAIRSMLELSREDRLAIVSRLAEGDRDRLGGQLREMLKLVEYKEGA